MASWKTLPLIPYKNRRCNKKIHYNSYKIYCVITGYDCRFFHPYPF